MLIRILMILSLAACLYSQEPDFPQRPEVFVEDTFQSAEGIAFNGEGRLFVTANRRVWEIGTDGSVTELCEVFSNAGLTAYGPRDLLVADPGPTTRLRHGKNLDGIIWRVTPEGERTSFVQGIPDPNFIAISPKGLILVSDDFSNQIWKIDTNGKTELFTEAINHPNGMVFSEDGRSLYVAQIFKKIRPIEFDNRLWRLSLADEGEPEMVFKTDSVGANDGLAIDALGRIYIAANREGRIWRYDPASKESVIVAEGMRGVASLAFGSDEFDPESIYATEAYHADGNGRIWKVHVGVIGQR